MTEEKRKPKGTINDPIYTTGDLDDHEGIACIVFNEKKDSILLAWHNKYGFWTIPMGKSEKIDNGDSLATLKREMQEEINITINNAKIEKVFIHKYHTKIRIVKIATRIYSVNKNDYFGEINNNEPNKHKELKWVKLKHLFNLKYTSAITDAAVKHLVVKYYENFKL